MEARTPSLLHPLARPTPELADGSGDHISQPSDSESDVDDMSQGNAQEKELRWRDITSKSDDYIEEFVKATQKEANSFTERKSQASLQVHAGCRSGSCKKLRRPAGLCAAHAG